MQLMISIHTFRCSPFPSSPPIPFRTGDSHLRATVKTVIDRSPWTNLLPRCIRGVQPLWYYLLTGIRSVFTSCFLFDVRHSMLGLFCKKRHQEVNGDTPYDLEWHKRQQGGTNSYDTSTFIPPYEGVSLFPFWPPSPLLPPTGKRLVRVTFEERKGSPSLLHRPTHGRSP